MKTFFALATLATVALAEDMTGDKTAFEIVPKANAGDNSGLYGGGSYWTMVDKSGRSCFMLEPTFGFDKFSKSYIFQWSGQFSDPSNAAYREQINVSYNLSSASAINKSPIVQQSCGTKTLDQLSGIYKAAERQNDEACTIFESVPDSAGIDNKLIKSSYMRLYDSPNSKITMKGGMKLTLDAQIVWFLKGNEERNKTLPGKVEVTVADAAAFGIASAGAVVTAVAALLAF